LIDCVGLIALPGCRDYVIDPLMAASLPAMPAKATLRLNTFISVVEIVKKNEFQGLDIELLDKMIRNSNRSSN